MATQIALIRSGEWLPAEEQIGNVLVALENNNNVFVDLSGVDYLDASSLQILLSLMMHQKEQSAGLHLMHVSPPLREWLDCAGASTYLQDTWSENA